MARRSSFWLTATALFEGALSTVFIVLAFLIPEVRVPFIATAVLLGFITAPIIVLGRRASAGGAPDEPAGELRPAQATVLSFSRSPDAEAGSGVPLDLVLRIEIGDAEAFEVKHFEVVPPGVAGRLVRGQTFAAQADPDRPDRVVVDWDR